jgi:prolyl-tRNA editing enzyme YbaK/EbsC (Cys-tRNA(Pro) deacylase)
MTLSTTTDRPGRHRRVAETSGGVAPIGHPAPLRTIVDIDLANFDEVWAAGGHPHYVFPTSFDELVRITSGTPADVGA